MIFMRYGVSLFLVAIALVMVIPDVSIIRSVATFSIVAGLVFCILGGLYDYSTWHNR